MFWQKSDFDVVPPLNLGDLDITTDEFILDEVDSEFCVFVFHHLSRGSAYNLFHHALISSLFFVLFLVHIQANLEDDLVKEALKTVR